MHDIVMHTFLVPVNFDLQTRIGMYCVNNPINKFDTTQKTALTSIETDLATMDSWITNIESLFTDGVTDINFPMERWTALSAENSLKTDLAHRLRRWRAISGNKSMGTVFVIQYMVREFGWVGEEDMLTVILAMGVYYTMIFVLPEQLIILYCIVNIVLKALPSIKMGF